jgi:CheY-like chemotaxis protein
MELLRARQPSRGGNIPVVALTAYGRPQDKRRALAAGFRIHLSKPIEPGDLLAALIGLTGRGGAP